MKCQILTAESNIKFKKLLQFFQKIIKHNYSREYQSINKFEQITRMSESILSDVV